MTERTLSELANAEVVPNAGGPNAWMVRFGEDDYDLVNKSAKNTLILKDGVLTEDTVSYGGIMVDFDLEDDSIVLYDGENRVEVPVDRHEHVLWSVHDEDGPRLNRLFDELYSPEVRQGLMDQFMPRFRQDQSEVRKTDDGWLVNGDILVSWDASNHPVNVAQTHVVNGGTTVEADESKEAREIQTTYDLSDDEEFSATAPDGRTFSITGTEARFLGTVGVILANNPTNYDDDLRSVISDMEVTAFTDTKSGLHHAHDLQKHTLDMLDVTEDAQSRLWYNEYDHTGVWEMAVRENEFRHAPIDVFEDAPNDSDDKWQKIHSTKEKAPIPKHVRSDLEARYE